MGVLRPGESWVSVASTLALGAGIGVGDIGRAGDYVPAWAWVRLWVKLGAVARGGEAGPVHHHGQCGVPPEFGWCWMPWWRVRAGTVMAAGEGWDSDGEGGCNSDGAGGRGQ